MSITRLSRMLVAAVVALAGGVTVRSPARQRPPCRRLLHVEAQPLSRCNPATTSASCRSGWPAGPATGDIVENNSPLGPKDRPAAVERSVPPGVRAAHRRRRRTADVRQALRPPGRRLHAAPLQLHRDGTYGCGRGGWTGGPLSPAPDQAERAAHHVEAGGVAAQPRRRADPGEQRLSQPHLQQPGPVGRRTASTSTATPPTWRRVAVPCARSPGTPPPAGLQRDLRPRLPEPQRPHPRRQRAAALLERAQLRDLTRRGGAALPAAPPHHPSRPRHRPLRRVHDRIPARPLGPRARRRHRDRRRPGHPGPGLRAGLLSAPRAPTTAASTCSPSSTCCSPTTATTSAPTAASTGQTETAVRSFQTAKGLTSDGVVGGNTWAKLVVPVAGGSQRPGRAGPAGAAQRQTSAPAWRWTATSEWAPPTVSARSSSHATITVDGDVGPTTWRNLLWHYDYPWTSTRTSATRTRPATARRTG